MQWKDLTRQEKEVLASRFGISCVGDMELQGEEELKKIPGFAWLGIEQKRELVVLNEEKRLKELANKEKAKLKMEKAEQPKAKKKKLKLGAKKTKKK